MGLICFPLIWNGDFFSKALHHSPLFLPLREQQQTQGHRAKVCHLSLASQGLFEGKKKHENQPKPYVEAKDITPACHSQVTPQLLLSLKMLAVLECRTGTIPTSWYFFCICRDKQCRLVVISTQDICASILSLSEWACTYWQLEYIFLNSVTLNSTHWKNYTFLWFESAHLVCPLLLYGKA